VFTGLRCHWSPHLALMAVRKLLDLSSTAGRSRVRCHWSPHLALMAVVQQVWRGCLLASGACSHPARRCSSGRCSSPSGAVGEIWAQPWGDSVRFDDGGRQLHRGIAGHPHPYLAQITAYRYDSLPNFSLRLIVSHNLIDFLTFNSLSLP
jgi:hypothetical protein